MMKIVCYFLLVSSFVLQTFQLDIPVIIEVEHLHETSYTIKWSIQNPHEYNLTRFRVLYKSSLDDLVYSDFKEWPAQITPIFHDISDEPYSAIPTQSNFECYNACIQDENCVFVVRKRIKGINCFLKAVFNDFENIALDEDSEAMAISGFSTEIELINVPYGYYYKFRVGVYDEISKQWTEFSQDSYKINSKFEMILVAQRIGFQSLKIDYALLPQISTREYTISKYSLKVSKSGLPFFTFQEATDLESFSLQPNYYDDVRSPTSVILIDEYILSDDACAAYCASFQDCIFYAFVNKLDVYDELDNGACVLKTKIDITNGTSAEGSYVSAYSLKTTRQSIFYNRIDFDVQYRFKVEYITPYGLKDVSNELDIRFEEIPVNASIVVHGLAATLNMSLPRTEAFARLFLHYGIASSGSTSYYMESSSNYNDSNAYTLEDNLDLDDCYDACAYNLSCKAIEWHNLICTFKTDTSNPIECETLCATMFDYENVGSISRVLKELNPDDEFFIDAFVITDDPFMVYHAVDVNKEPILLPYDLGAYTSPPYIEGNEHLITCNYSVDESLVEMVLWNFNFHPVKLTDDLGFDFSNNNKTLIIKSLNHTIHNGYYVCMLLLKYEILLTKSTMVQLEVEYPLELKIESPVVTSTIGQEIEIMCFSDDYTVLTARWRKSDSDEALQNVDLLDTHNLRLIFENLTIQDNGTYVCELQNDTSVFAKLDLIVQYPPSKPIITELKAVGKELKLKWAIKETGQSNLTSFQIEIAKSFSGASNSAYYYFTTLPYTSKEEHTLVVDIFETSFLRMKVFNLIGESAYSDLMKVDINIQGKVSKRHDYFIPFVIILVLISIILITALILLFREKVKSNFISRKKHLDSLSLDVRAYHNKE